MKTIVSDIFYAIGFFAMFTGAALADSPTFVPTIICIVIGLVCVFFGCCFYEEREE